MDKHIKFAKSISDLLDNKFEFLGIKFGLDPLIGSVPLIGDVIPIVVSLYFIWIGIKLKIPKSRILQMCINTVVDTLVGFIPVIGDLYDITYRSNYKNFMIISQFFEDKNRPGFLLTSQSK